MSIKSTPRCVSLCCSLCCMTAACILAFLYLHAGNADNISSQPSLLVVYSPVLVGATILLLAACLMPCILPGAHLPTFRSRVTLGLGALSTLTISAHNILTDPAASLLLPSLPPAFYGWRVALSPLAFLLLVRAATTLLICDSSSNDIKKTLAAHAAQGAPSRISALIELGLAGGALYLLYDRLVMGIQHEWWIIAAPLIALHSLQVVLSCITLNQLTKLHPPPPHAKDRVEWVIAREAVSAQYGCWGCASALHRTSPICFLANSFCWLWPSHHCLAGTCSILALPAICTFAAQVCRPSECGT